jgi:hypothetical protein
MTWGKGVPELPADDDYRAYVLDEDDRIVTRHEFSAKDTTAALDFAARYVDGHDVEVWLRSHLIGRLKHEP